MLIAAILTRSLDSVCLRNDKVDFIEERIVEKPKEAASNVWGKFVHRIVSKCFRNFVNSIFSQ